MPIQPNNQHFQPAEFTKIRALVLKRAHNHCEYCGVSNGLCVTDGRRWYPVVLSIAHLDHDPTNNDPSNLRALCQRCFRKFDSETNSSSNVTTVNHKDKSLDIPFNY